MLMDLRTKELVDFTKTKFGLEHYDLKDYKFYRKVNLFNETVYTLSMDWLPNGVFINEDELNPKGTACININVGTKKFEQVIFVEGTTFANGGITFQHKEDVIKWIERETGLTYGQQFHLVKGEKGKFIFQSIINGVKLYPSGTIEIQVDQEGKLILFSIHGHFPSEEEVKKEKFSLSLEMLQPLIKEQVKLIETPNFEEKTLLPVYAVEEIFITNDRTKTIPFDFYSDINQYLKFDETMFWNEPMNGSLERKRIHLDEELSAEQAFSCEPSPDSFPITKEEQEKCTLNVKRLLQQEYPTESGHWMLKNLYREKGYLLATLKAKQQSNHVFQRKIKVFIHPKTFEVVNYIDNQEILKDFDDFHITSEIQCTKEEAIEKLKSFFELQPTYVFDHKQKQYILCGKLDCQYGVNAITGEVTLLNEF